MTDFLFATFILSIFVVVNSQSIDGKCKIDLIRDIFDFAKFVDIDEKTTKSKSVSISSFPCKFSSHNRHLIISFKFSSIIKSIFLRGSISAFNISYRLTDKNEWNSILDRKGFPKIFPSTDDGISHNFEFPIVADQLRISLIRGSNLLNVFDIKVVGCKDDSKCFHFDSSLVDNCLNYDLKQRGYVVSVKNHLSFRVKTYQSNGILLSSFGNQYDLILISVRIGRIDVLIDFGSRTASRITGMMAINDGNWHRVDLFHDERNIFLFVDGLRINETQSYGANYRLDLDRKIYIGCAPLVRPLLSFLAGMENFTGILQNLTLNDQHLLIDSKNSNAVDRTKKCTDISPPPSITFAGSAGWIEKTKLPIKNQLSLKFWLRAFSKNAIILLAKPSDGRISETTLEIRDGKLRLALNGLGDTVFIRSAVDAADSLWHTVEFNMTANCCSLRIDDLQKNQAEGNFSFKSPDKIRFGGFAGCLRGMKINGNAQEFFLSDPHSVDDVSWSGCNFRDQCYPNPCFTGGSCTAKWASFLCSCQPGYFGTTCESINLPKSCQEFFEFGDNSTRNETIFLDMDGSGPLDPIKVSCQRRGPPEDQVILTVVDHDQTSPGYIKGFAGRGEGQIVFNYNASRTSLVELVKRHKRCRQEMIFECFGGTRIMNSPSLTSGPPTWWMGFSAVHIHSWGTAEPGTRSCDCASTGTCLNGKNCNCDSGQDAFDAGNVTFREHLPIRRVFVGDTNFFGKHARISIGSLICEDYFYRNPVTLRTLGAFLSLNDSQRPKNKNDAGKVEIYLEFLTTLKSFTLLSNHPVDSFDFLSIHYTEGNLVLELVASGSVLFLNHSSIDLSDNRWHSVYAVVAKMDAYLVVDHLMSKSNRFAGSLAEPRLGSIWRLGASIEYGSVFAGAFRSVIINGVDYDLPSAIVDPEHRGTVSGLKKRCGEKHSCSNGGVCLEFYTHFECDCSRTPFEGPFCSRDVSFDLSEHQLGPYTVYSMRSPIFFRVGFMIRTKKSTVLLRSYVDDRTKSNAFSLKFTPKGIMQMTLNYSKKSYVFNDTRFEFNDQSFYDVSLKISTNFIVWQVGNYEPLKFYVENAESIKKGKSFWLVGESNFFGCVSKMQIGDDVFPLKLIQSISLKDGIRRSFCSSNVETALNFEEPSYTVPSGVDRTLPKLVIRPVDKTDPSFLVGVCTAVAIFCVILLFCCAYRCWRTRPSGEYKTHEDQLIYMTGDSSQQALVPSNRIQSPRREWFI